MLDNPSQDSQLNPGPFPYGEERGERAATLCWDREEPFICCGEEEFF